VSAALLFVEEFAAPDVEIILPATHHNPNFIVLAENLTFIYSSLAASAATRPARKVTKAVRTVMADIPECPPFNRYPGRYNGRSPFCYVSHKMCNS
jgi:hypothetical protein